MRKRTSSLAMMLLVAAVVACESPAGKVSAKQSTTKPLEQRLADSLRTYWHLTSFQLDSDSARYKLYGQETTAGKLGVVALADSVLLLYQGNRQGMRLAGRVPFHDRVSGVKAEDLNGDCQDDIIVLGNPNMHGQAFPYVFLQTGQTLQHRPDITLPNLSYDADRKLVRSYYIGKVFDGCSKGLYQWQHDSLRQVAGAELLPNATPWSAANMPPPGTDYTKLVFAQVQVFRLRNGRKYSLRTYHKEAAFDTALFTQDYYR